MIIDDVVTQANSLLIHHPDAITDLKTFISSQEDPFFYYALFLKEIQNNFSVKF